MPEDLCDFVFFSKNVDRASGILVLFLSKSQVICQDAINLNIVTDAEKSVLIAWRKYRVLLKRGIAPPHPISHDLGSRNNHDPCSLSMR
ncbi:tail fiber assembly protein [Xenorhabdus thailandensis]|uniref:tail fiber assembly protein n=1 Tax=Xenorhabdus thailandensis TaxID=3136255 RepID=UPI0030F42FFC